MSRYFFLSLLLFFGLQLKCQITIDGQYSNKYLKFVGYSDSRPVFLNYSKNHLSADENNMLFVIADDMTLKLLQRNQMSDGVLIFIQDDLKVYKKYDNEYTFTINKNGVESIIHTGLTGVYSANVSCQRKNLNLFFFGFGRNQNAHTVSPSNNFSTVNELPILGLSSKVNGDYLYFDYYHFDKNLVTPCPVDLYRIKIGDWNNPELIAEFISDIWLPINDSIVIVTLPMKGKAKQVVYNILNKSYIESDYLPTTLLEYNSNGFLLGVNDDFDKYVMYPIPQFAMNGYTQDDEREVLKRVIEVNLPNSQKQFTNTFITEQLLYEATEAQVSKLTKDELRILRNAFFARQGYQFSSKDLQEFFGQFGWYHKMVERNKFLEITNELVVIAPIDKERVALIKEIESRK